MSSARPWRRLLVALLLWPGITLAQSLTSEPPIAGRPADFSGIVGQYEIQASAAPTHVAVEQPITVRIRITGQGPAKYEPKRETLRIFPDSWEKHFYVEESRDEHLMARGDNTWTFVYRLRPKHAKIDAIDGIKLVYYDPEAPGKKKFVTRFVDPIPITVQPRPDDGNQISIVIPAVPDRFYHSVSIDDLRTGPPAPLSFAMVPTAALLGGVPLACIVGAVIWRRCCPDEAERRKRKRQRAAQNARLALRKGAMPAWEIVHEYLHDRFDFALEEPTPAEAARHLLRLGFAKELCGQCKTLLQACDALRYGASTPGDKNPNADVDRLIAALEADPCAR